MRRARMDTGTLEKRRTPWGFVVVPTCCSLVVAEVVVAMAAIVPAVLTSRAKQQEALADAVNRLGGRPVCFNFNASDNILTGTGCSPDWFNQTGRWLDDFQNRLRPIEVIEFGRSDGELECLAFTVDSARDFGDAELEGLVKLPAMNKVRSFEFAGTSISDASLWNLGQLTSLEYLDIACTNVSAKGAEELRRALPNCKITYFARRKAIHGREFGSKDYHAIESLAFKLVIFTNVEGRHPTSERFLADLKEANRTLADIDLDALSKHLKNDILFFGRVETMTAIRTTIPIACRLCASETMAWFDEQAFRAELAAAMKTQVSASFTRRIGTPFDFTIEKVVPPSIMDEIDSWLRTAYCLSLGRALYCSLP